MHRRHVRRLLAAAAGAMVLAGSNAAAPPEGAARAGATGWRIVPSPALFGGELLGVAALNESDAWAVGSRAVGGVFSPFSEHWNGTSWSAVPMPAPTDFNQLRSVTMVSPTDVWAVGVTGSWAGLIEHWDGSAWKVVASPVQGAQTPIYGVAGFAADDVWAVGENGQRGMLLHFDGVKWSTVPHPEPAGATLTVFAKVAGTSPTDVWAVGESEGSSQQTLVEHFDRTRWRLVRSARHGRYNYVRGLAVRAAGDAWLVGDWQGPAPDYTEHPLVQHWDGTAWSSVRSHAGEPWGIAAVSPTDAWLVGSRTDPSVAYVTLIEHWDGTAWTVVRGPSTGNGDSELNDVVALPSGVVWAVGSYSPAGADQPLIELNPAG